MSKGRSRGFRPEHVVARARGGACVCEGTPLPLGTALSPRGTSQPLKTLATGFHTKAPAFHVRSHPACCQCQLLCGSPRGDLALVWWQNNMPSPSLSRSCLLHPCPIQSQLPPLPTAPSNPKPISPTAPSNPDSHHPPTHPGGTRSWSGDRRVCHTPCSVLPGCAAGLHVQPWGHSP
jgi:hypothetical protein